MLRSQRLTTIVKMIDAHGSVTVDNLVDTLDISPATARRDLDALAADGHCRRTRGGASAKFSSYTVPLHHRRSEKTAEKTAIARYCLQFLQPGSVVGMTGGTTVSAVADALVDWALEHTPQDVASPQPILTVVTNAIDVAYRIAGRANIKIIVLGGQLNSGSLELTGPFALTTLQQLWFDVAFIGVNGFTERGPGTADEYEAHTNRAMVQRATTAIVVTDSSKFGRMSFSSVGTVETIREVVTDPGISPDTVAQLQEAGYRVHIAPMDDHPGSTSP